MLSTYKDKNIWIIGASSGIGEALAKELALRGATIALSARNSKTLENVRSSLKGNHSSFPIDVTDSKALEITANAVYSKFKKLDSIIFLAAQYEPGLLQNMNIEKMNQIIDINLKGAFNTVHAILPIMQQQQYGQIALCGSVAGYCGLPAGQPYSATKAGVMNLAESLHSEMKDTAIDIKLISPGFVRTPMIGKNPFPMPMIIEPEQAAREIADGLLTKHFEIHFPKRFTLFIKLLRLLPYSLFFPITKRLVH